MWRWPNERYTRAANRRGGQHGERRSAQGDCAHCIEGCCDYGICELEFEEAFSAQEAKEPMAAWEAAKWARDWIVEHYKDMQEDWCKRFDG